MSTTRPGAKAEEGGASRARQLWRRWWPHLRVVFIAYHIVAVVLLALPSNGKTALRKTWKSERNQKELARWSKSLSSVGIDVTPAELEEKMWSLSKGYVSLRRSLLGPFSTYIEYAGVRQGWRMFTNPQTHPSVLHVDIEVDGAWKPIFVFRSDEHDWRWRQFEHNRMRKQLGRMARKSGVRAYDQIVRWVAGEIAADFPEATRMRARLYRYDSLSADAVRRGEVPAGEFGDRRVFDLESFR